MFTPYFPTEYLQILERLEAIQPLPYGHTRNYIDGAVTMLSPYISRGVISTNLVLQHLIQHHPVEHSLKLIQELAWRDYFQQVWLHTPQPYNDIKHPQPGVLAHGIPPGLLHVNCHILVINQLIEQLYNTGYMHNHARMYVASLICNIAHAHWKQPSQWMYYYLLDADMASNTCSWQWVAGSFSNKPYFFNQNNLNTYTKTNQTQTLIDTDYERLPSLTWPENPKDYITPDLKTTLPATSNPQINTTDPVLLYHPYHLDPLWRKETSANRILILEPSRMAQFPMHHRTIQFICELGKNIPGLQVYAGEYKDLLAITGRQTIYTREHPVYHYPGAIADKREWMFPTVEGYFPSFFAYWKKCEKLLHALTR